MVRFLSLFLILFALPAHALTVSGAGVGTVTVCGQVLSTTNLKHLYCKFSAGNNRCNFREATNTTTGAAISAGYTPSGATKFRIQVVHYTVIAGNTNAYFEMGYSDNDLGFTSGGTWTNGVMAAGQAQGTNGAIPMLAANVTSANNSMDQQLGQCIPFVNMLIPNGKYPGTKGDGTNIGFVDIYGYEE